MRIIGGFLKGRKIFDAVDKSTRPLKDMVRESIFNILDTAFVDENLCAIAHRGEFETFPSLF